MFKSTKLFDGFSCCFRQWKAETTHCKYLHGYGVSFRVTFDGMSPKEWMDYMFDHTVIVAEDDPYVNTLQQMGNAGIAQVRVLI